MYIINTCKQTELSGKPTVRELDIVTNSFIP